MERGIQPIFEGLEELSQVELCQELGVPLMQGYVLARPEIAPTSFNRTYPNPSSMCDRKQRPSALRCRPSAPAARHRPLASEGHERPSPPVIPQSPTEFSTL